MVRISVSPGLLVSLTVFIITFNAITVSSIPIGSYCEILAIVVSETKTPFKFKIELPNGQQTEELIYEQPGNQSVILKGYNCAAEHWKLSTYTRDPTAAAAVTADDGQWQLANQSIVKLSGAGGQMTVKVNDSLEPRIGARYGVACGESAICGGGPLGKGATS